MDAVSSGGRSSGQQQQQQQLHQQLQLRPRLLKRTEFGSQFTLQRLTLQAPQLQCADSQHRLRLGHSSFLTFIPPTTAFLAYTIPTTPSFPSLPPTPARVSALVELSRPLCVLLCTKTPTASPHFAPQINPRIYTHIQQLNPIPIPILSAIATGTCTHSPHFIHSSTRYSSSLFQYSLPDDLGLVCLSTRTDLAFPP